MRAAWHQSSTARLGTSLGSSRRGRPPAGPPPPGRSWIVRWGYWEPASFDDPPVLDAVVAPPVLHCGWQRLKLSVLGPGGELRPVAPADVPESYMSLDFALRSSLYDGWRVQATVPVVGVQEPALVVRPPLVGVWERRRLCAKGRDEKC